VNEGTGTGRRECEVETESANTELGAFFSEVDQTSTVPPPIATMAKIIIDIFDKNPIVSNLRTPKQRQQGAYDYTIVAMHLYSEYKLN
jgi:hypothetical protein